LLEHVRFLWGIVWLDMELKLPLLFID